MGSRLLLSGVPQARPLLGGGMQRRTLFGGLRSSLLEGLVGYWKLDEASGNAIDSHWTGRNLTDNNTVTSAAGKINDARSFASASSEFFSRASDADLSTGDVDFTCATWVFITDKTAFRDVISKSGAATGDEFALFYHVTDDRFAFHIRENGTGSFLRANATDLGSPSTSTWYFLVGWYQASNNTVHVKANDGADNSAAGGNGTIATNENFYIGTYRGGSSLWNGRIDEAAFWKRLLTSAEMTLLYNNGNGLTYPF